MKVYFTRLLLAFMLVWLPIQGYASEAMSFCPHQHEDAPMQMAADGHEGCHGQDHGTTIAKSGVACDNCFSCHLIAQPALIVAPLALVVDSSRSFQRPFNLTFSLFFPEQLQRPPLAFLS
ncbi:MAG: hypothetical protein Q8K01_12050 [Sulfurimicrobium sp.]|nr:hypothetical protein [Sulfurimicrobium sp.]MDP1705442.1 hypothetical protein [Sulfurimicrobium sp.]MDP2199309.1 hypothetical protein [Sulfurimicrobium sp.]MDP3687211.1 hypothetical protein [Sulfurimicrobium sp.]